MPRGGFRAGAGRKPPPGRDAKIEKTWMVRPDLARWIAERAQEAGVSESEYIEPLLERDRINALIVTDPMAYPPNSEQACVARGEEF